MSLQSDLLIRIKSQQGIALFGDLAYVLFLMRTYLVPTRLITELFVGKYYFYFHFNTLTFSFNFS